MVRGTSFINSESFFLRPLECMWHEFPRKESQNAMASTSFTKHLNHRLLIQFSVLCTSICCGQYKVKGDLGNNQNLGGRWPLSRRTKSTSDLRDYWQVYTRQNIVVSARTSLAFPFFNKNFTHLTNYTNNVHQTHYVFQESRRSAKCKHTISFTKPEALTSSSPNSTSCNSETHLQ